MLKMTVGGITCRISLLFPAVLLWMLLWDPTGYVLLGVTAAILHEGGHLIAFIIFGKRPKTLTVSYYGMRMTYSADSAVGYAQEAFIATAGPLMNLLCAGCLYCFGGSQAACLLHIGLAAVNLLPIVPLDGGCILLSLLRLLPLSDTTVVRLTTGISYGSFVGILLLSIAVYTHSGNMTMVLFSLYVGLFILFYKEN